VTSNRHVDKEESILETNRGTDKGVRTSQEDSNMRGPNGWAGPDVGPMLSILVAAMSFLQADNVCLQGAKIM
jgi:hypothetical protein